MEAEEVVDTFLQKKKLYNLEGEAGIKNLNALCFYLGYEEYSYKYGSSLERFLCDNPEAIEAIIDFIKNADHYEWHDALAEELDLMEQ
jgi:hypothetical protein